MAGDFGERMRALIEQVGPGEVVVTDTVDQVYAKYQELRDDLHHPGGGQAHAMQGAVYQQVPQIMQLWADGLLTERGCELDKAGERISELIARRYHETAPFEFGDLAGSTHPVVTNNGRVVYERPPGVHRLSKDELREKGITRQLGFGHDLADHDFDAALGVSAG